MLGVSFWLIVLAFIGLPPMGLNDRGELRIGVLFVERLAERLAGDGA